MYQSDGRVKGAHEANHPLDHHRVTATDSGEYVFEHLFEDRKAETVGPKMPDRQAVGIVSVAHRYAQHGGDQRYA